LFRLRETLVDKYPKPALEYLDDWAKGENAYLRKYYPERGDEPEFDLTPATEKAIEWLRSLEQRPFVGTESRLLNIFRLLQEVVQATETDPVVRIASLERKKAELDVEIVRLKAGQDLYYDPTRIKERYYQIEDMVRRLLSDFRQVEENFRQLDRRTREKITTSSKTKGQLLDDIFSEEDNITASDEGRSFQAFWEFLMSPERQEELQALTGRLLALKEVRALAPDDLLPHLKYRLMDSGEKVKKTSASLIEHLRRFLDDRAWIENKRIMELIRSVERRAVDLRQDPPQNQAFAELVDLKPDIDLTMARGLFKPMPKIPLRDEILSLGAVDFVNDLLYDVHFVDETVLRERLRNALRESSQVTLADVLNRFPLEKGLGELLTYLHIATKDSKVVIDDDVRQTVEWLDANGQTKRASVPRVLFLREKVVV